MYRSPILSGLLLDFDVYGLNCYLWFMMQFTFKTCWEGQSNCNGPSFDNKLKYDKKNNIFACEI